MEEEKNKFIFKHDTKLPVKLFLTVKIITLKNWSEKVPAPPLPPLYPTPIYPTSTLFLQFIRFFTLPREAKKKFTLSNLKKSGSKLWMLDWVLNKSLLIASLKLRENFTTENTEV